MFYTVIQTFQFVEPFTDEGGCTVTTEMSELL